MLTPVKAPKRSIDSYKKEEGLAYLYSEFGTTRIGFYEGNCVRVSFTEGREFKEGQGEYMTLSAPKSFSAQEYKSEYKLSSGELEVSVDKATGAVSYYKKGTLLFSEDPLQEKMLSKFDALRLKKNGKIETMDIKTADGIKKRVVSAEREYYDSFYETRTHFVFDKDEAIYGLGQYEEGVFNHRGTTRYIHQANKQISLPVFVSSKGYGVMFTTMSPAIFSDTSYGTYIYTSADRYIDYFFMAPASYEDIVSDIRRMTGSAVMLPKWAYSYVQSKERYETEKEILKVADEFIKRDIPLGCIVLDWMSWEDGMWGEKIFDKKRFPHVKEMVKKLNDKGVHFMLSIWPSMNEKTQNYKEFAAKNLLLPGTNVYDAFDDKAGKLYFKQVKEGLLSEDVESFWCDSSEPITPEWEVREKPLPEALFAAFKERCMDSMYIDKGNGYGLYHAKNLYEGLRKERPDKRVLNLTRSGYYGSQSYGAVVWSGDISASWDVFNKQITAGLSLAMCGMAYWTLDIGAFFVKKGREWYWNGRYEDGADNFGYRELYTRWLQYGTFLSMFRSHGTDVSREPWNFGEKGEPFYDAIVASINLRETLMPYIYSVAASVSLKDKMFIKPLFFAFPKDKESYRDLKQFMVGDSLMVCPVTRPMYYDESGKAIKEKKTITVWLPKGTEWVDYYTNTRYKGGQYVEVKATIDRIPLFVKAGSILPVMEKGRMYLNVYAGKNCSFDLYNDAGEGYGYEKGEYSLQCFKWDEKNSKLTMTVKGDDRFVIDGESRLIR